MSLLDSCMSIVEPGYHAPQARMPVDRLPDHPAFVVETASRKCACGKPAIGRRRLDGTGRCRSCALSYAMTKNVRRCLHCTRGASRGDVVCGRRVCRKVA